MQSPPALRSQSYCVIPQKGSPGDSMCVYSRVCVDLSVWVCVSEVGQCGPLREGQEAVCGGQEMQAEAVA